ncbi:MAG: hypothetical protein RR060_06095 [Victivallaceae bacterium]
MINKLMCRMGILLLLLSCGCVRVDYSGMRLRNQEPGRIIEFFNEDELYPENLAVLGRADITTKQKIRMDVIEEKLLDKADEVGASAVKIVKYKREIGDNMLAPTSAPANPNLYSGNAKSGAPGAVKFDKLGQGEVLNSSRKKVHTLHIEAVMLADRDEVNSAIDKAEAAREKYLAAQPKRQDKAARF